MRGREFGTKQSGSSTERKSKWKRSQDSEEAFWDYLSSNEACFDIDNTAQAALFAVRSWGKKAERAIELSGEWEEF